MLLRTRTGAKAFSNWRWDNNGTMVPWEQFFDKPITTDMDLYPETWQVKATDAQDVAMTDQLTWAIDVSALETSSAPAAEGSAATPNAEKQTYPIQAYFGQGNYYDQKHLTVHVEKRSYKPSSEPTYQPGNPLPADRDASAALGQAGRSVRRQSHGQRVGIACRRGRRLPGLPGQ